MKIALISPPLLLTPPSGYGGLERVVYDLGCALVTLGHDVTLIAPPGSKIDGGTLIPTIPAAGTNNVNWIQKEQEAYAVYKDLLGDFDVIHDHSWFGFAYMSKFNPKFKDLKICHTHHGHLDWNAKNVPAELGNINLIGISDFMRQQYAKQGWGAKYVYNGIDLTEYPFRDTAPDVDNPRLVFVGRISKFKMPHAAIKAAVEANIPIDVVGGTFVDDPQYVEDIKKECENSGGIATLHFDVPNAEKVSYVRGATAQLVPSKMGEPFGLIAVEAMSCGTPVIAFDDGALKEIVNSKKVGTICKDYDGLIAAIKNISNANYDADACRTRAEYFSREKMAERYVKAYEEVIKGKNW